jgi:hypothetical protein
MSGNQAVKRLRNPQRSALKSSAPFAFAAALILLTAAGGYGAEPPVPAWRSQTPTPRGDVNYFYVAVTGRGETPALADDDARRQALNSATFSGAVDVGTVERRTDVCYSGALQVTQHEYIVYSLYTVQRNDGSSDVHNSNNDKIKCRDPKFEKALKLYSHPYALAQRERELEERNAKIQKDIDARDARVRRELDAKNAIIQEREAKLQRIEAGLADTRRDIDLAMGLLANRREKDAQVLIEQCEKRLESFPDYVELRLERAKSDSIGSAVSGLRGEISALKFEMKPRMSFFIDDGKWDFGGAKPPNVAARLKGLFSKKGYEVVENRADAAFYVSFDVSVCKVVDKQHIDAVTCQVCVSAKITTAAAAGAGRIKVSDDFTIPDKPLVARDMESACGKAAEGVAEEIWNRLMKDASVFSK